MLVTIGPLAIAIIGVLVYALASNAKAAEVGRIAYFVGLLWLVSALVHSTFRVG